MSDASKIAADVPNRHQRAIFWERPSNEPLPFSKELVNDDDPRVDFYDSVSKASVRLLNETLSTREMGKGSGTVISSDGLVLTSDHVIHDDADFLIVEFSDGSRREAKPVFRSKTHDLAIVQALNTHNQPYLPLASNKPLTAMENVVVCGHPNGWKTTFLSPGVVTAVSPLSTAFHKPNRFEGMADSQDVLLMDCRIEPGNSGSGVIDQNKQIVGVAFGEKSHWSTDKYGIRLQRVQDCSLAVPISTLRDALELRPDLLRRLGWK